MNMNGDAAEQVLRMSLEGTEAAVKITGAGAEKIAKLLYKLLKDLAKESNKTKGQMRLANMIKSGKKLEIFELPDTSLKKFCEMAKNYGVVYTVLKDKSLGDGMTEIMVKSEDSQKINHILRRMEIAVTNTGAVETDAEKVMAEHNKGKEPEKTGTATPATTEIKPDEKKQEATVIIPTTAVATESQTPPEVAPSEKTPDEKFAEEIFNPKNPTQEVAQSQNPTVARNAKSRQSVPSSTVREGTARESSDGRSLDTGRRPSVRAELKEYREEIRRAEENKGRTRARTPMDNTHKAPARKRKPKETAR